MKVKIFDCENEIDLERKINDFILKIKVYDIKYQIMAFQSHGEQIYCFSAMILFE